MHTLLIGLGIISASYFLGHLLAKAWASFLDFGQRRFDDVYGDWPHICSEMAATRKTWGERAASSSGHNQTSHRSHSGDEGGK